jgi:hypothetical protein
MAVAMSNSVELWLVRVGNGPDRLSNDGIDPEVNRPGPQCPRHFESSL